MIRHFVVFRSPVLAFATLLLSNPLAAQPRERDAGPVHDLISGCAPCHGIDGVSKDGEVPNLAGQNEPYLVNQLHAFHTGRREHKEMRYMSRKMTEDEIEALAAYYSSLPPR